MGITIILIIILAVGGIGLIAGGLKLSSISKQGIASICMLFGLYAIGIAYLILTNSEGFA